MASDRIPGKSIPYHFVLLAAYPALALYASNASDFNLKVIVFPLLFSLLLGALFFLLSSLVFRSVKRGAIGTAIFLLLFFAHEHLYALLLDFDIFVDNKSGPVKYGPNIIWLPSCLLVAAGCFKLYRLQEPLLTALNRFFNKMALVLVLFPIAQIIFFQPADSDVAVEGLENPFAPVLQDSLPPELLPDIYFIILDGYGRQDRLQEFYGFDNSRMIEELEERNFQIADEACSNYGQTVLSVASMLNGLHINPIRKHWGDGEFQGSDLHENYILKNNLFRTLRSLQYEVVAFSSGYPMTDMSLADRYLMPADDYNEYMAMFFNMTPVSDVFYHYRDMFRSHKKRIEFIFDGFGELALEKKGPRFTMAHVVCPHPPFVFHQDGSLKRPPMGFAYKDASHLRRKLRDVYDDEAFEYYYRQGYIDNLKYINFCTLETVDTVLRNTSRPVLMVIASDHGPGLNTNWHTRGDTLLSERMSTLLAIRLHRPASITMPENITPVNMFRYIFQEISGCEIPFVGNNSYFSEWEDPLNFIEYVPEAKAVEAAAVNF